MMNVTDTATLGGPSHPSGRRGRRRAGLVLVAVLAVLAVVLAGGALAYAKQFEGRALPGTTVLGQDVAGQTSEEISTLVAERGQDVTVTVTAGDRELEVPLAELGVTVDAAATGQAALDREDSFTDVLASTWSGEHPVEPVVDVDEAAVSQFAKDLIPDDRTTAVDAQVTFDEEAQTWNAEPGRSGQGVDPQTLVDQVTAQAASLQDFSVEQPIEEIAPAITTAEAEEVVGTIATLLEQPMTIAGADGETHEVSAERRNGWISVVPAESGKTLQIAVDEESVREWVTARADQANVEPENGIEQVDGDGNVVKVVSEPQDGLSITNSDAVAEQLITSLKGITPLEAAFESTVLEAEMNQVDAPKPEKESTNDSAPARDAPAGEKWIDVDLSNKTVTAYVGDTPVWGPRTMVDGKEGYETVTGTYEIYLRYDVQDMTNANYYPEDHPKYYYIEDVPWVQYFHRGYGFHGAPWRSSFGYSGSHGCINMPVSDAKWLYDWASIGTKTVVHY